MTLLLLGIYSLAEAFLALLFSLCTYDKLSTIRRYNFNFQLFFFTIVRMGNNFCFQNQITVLCFIRLSHRHFFAEEHLLMPLRFTKFYWIDESMTQLR